MIGCVGFGLYEELKAAGRSKRSFYAYSVLVVPQLHCLLLDYKLIKDAEEFRQRWEKGLKDVLSIHFTVVGAQRDVDLPGLVYWDNRKSFVTRVDFEEPVKTVKFEEPVTILAGLEEALGLPPREVTWFFRDGGGGYELGLTVPTGWWKRIRATSDIGELAKTDAEDDALTGNTQLVVATLPWQEFDIYYHKNEYVDHERRQKQKELADKQLSKYGWKQKDRSGGEVPDPWHRLEHRYFTIQHRSI